MEVDYNRKRENVKISDLVGKTLKKIEKDEVDSLFFLTECGTEYLMFHWQDCCESVFIEDICGNLDDLIGSPILMAECITEIGEIEDRYDECSYTWTFYKLATVRGYVTIRWYGISNGYYSEEVSFIKYVT